MGLMSNSPFSLNLSLEAAGVTRRARYASKDTA